ncbi:MAG: hypothetical protein KDA61_04400, partial [Planctomycetales bacterium]|nr:hypothetical protein [Planctomycetales bacterium]
MRLTLRTLLAYMDDVLDPADHEALGEKIEASEFATELIHRTRDAVRRLRLGAPSVLDDDGDLHEDGHDANLVAEYLDSTVDPEQVATFERGCLDAGHEADIRLAEVASCHHILTMVLGEPAQVDEDLRRRIYQLVEAAGPATGRIEPAHSFADAPPAPPAPTSEAALEAAPALDQPLVESPPLVVAAPVAASQHETRHTVPDYLLEAKRSQRRTRRWLVAASLGGLLGAGVAFVLWPSPPPELPAELAGGAFDDDGVEGSGLAPLEIDDLDMGELQAFDPSASGADEPAPDAAMGQTDSAESMASGPDADEAAFDPADGASVVGDRYAQDAPTPEGMTPKDTTPADLHEATSPALAAPTTDGAATSGNTGDGEL